MKKSYIQPIIAFISAEEAEIIAGSGKVVVEDYTDKKDQNDINSNLEGGDGKDFAKQSWNSWDDDED